MKLEILPDINEAYKIYKKKRSEERKALCKLRNLKAKYEFINTLTKIGANKRDDIELEWAVLKLFKSIGFVCSKPISNADVDVKAKFKQFEFGIEVKNGNLVQENDMFQAFKYKNRNCENFHPLVVYNNAKTKQGFDDNRRIDAERNGYTIITTSDLLKGYTKLKNNKISFVEFLNRLVIPGLVTFSRKDIGRSINSDDSGSGSISVNLT